MYYLLPVNVLIASYEQIRADTRSLSSQTTFDVVVLDEAQRIKNLDSQTALGRPVLRPATGDKSDGLAAGLSAVCRQFVGNWPV